MPEIPDFKLTARISRLPDFRYGSFAQGKQYDPYKAAQTTVAHDIARLQAAGITPPKVPTHPNLLTTALDILDRPAAAVRGAVHAALTPEKESILGEAWKGLTGKAKVTGSDILKDIGIDPSNKIAKWALSTGIEILLDPTTYLTLGTTSLAKKAATESAEAIAKRVAREVASETGKTISNKSALMLAQNALKGNIPVGRLGTAIQRALGRQAETAKIVSHLPEIEQTVAKRQAGQLLGKTFKSTSSAAKAVYKAAFPEKGTAKIAPDVASELLQRLQVPKRVTTVTKVAGEIPVHQLELGSFMGFTKPVTTVDITKLVNTLRGFAGKVGGKPGQKLFDLAGRVFVRDYTPSTIKGTLRTTIQEAKRRIGQTELMAPASAQQVLRDVLRDWKKTGIPEDALEKAAYLIEEPKTPEYKALEKAKTKLSEATNKLNELLQTGASARAIAGKQRSVNIWTKKLAEAQAAFDAHRMKLFGTTTIPREVSQAANRAIKMFAEDASRYVQGGMPLHLISNYVQHLYYDPPEKVNAVLQKFFNTQRISAAHPAFAKERLIEFIEKAEDLGLHPVKNVAITTTVHRAMTEQALAIQNLGKSLLKLGSDVIRPAHLAPPDWVPIKDTTIPILKGTAVHPEVAKTLERLYTVVKYPDEAAKALNSIYDKVMRIVKSGMTAWNPAFHPRQLAGNIFLNLIDGLFDPTIYAVAEKVLRGKPVSIDIGGKAVSGELLRRLFETYGLAGQGFVRQFEYPQPLLKQAVQEAEDIGITAATKQGRLRRLMGIPTRLGVYEDSLARMANFIYNLKRGMSPTQAAEHTREVLYDYGALTDKEQFIRRYLVPFYAWMRFNTPAMLRLMATRPGTMLALQHAIESGKAVNNIDDKDVPTWLRDMLAIPVGVTPEGNYRYLNLSLPPADLARLHSVSDWPEIGKEVLNALNPLYTVPFQVIANKNLFTNMDISKYPDLPMQRLKDALKFALSQMGPVREIAATQRFMAATPEKPLTTQHIPGLGSVITYVNPQAVRRNQIYELRDLLQQVIQLKKAQGVPVPDWNTLKKAVRQSTKTY
jgi:hypothetical protein